MNIYCTCCGKKFDTMASAGRCPYCGFMVNTDEIADSPAEESSKTDAMWDEYTRKYVEQYEKNLANEAKQAAMPNQDYADNHDTRYKTGRNNKNGNSVGSAFGKAFRVILVVFMGLMLLGTIITVSNNKETIEYNESRYVTNSDLTLEDISTENVKLGEEFVYKDYCDNYNHITFTELKEYTDVAYPVPDGYSMYKLTYNVVQKTEDGVTITDENAGIYTMYEYVYIVTKNGDYIEPLDSYDLKAFFDLDQNTYSHELVERNISDNIDYFNGEMYFIVKTGDIDHMEVYFQEYDSENWELEGVNQIVKIDGLEVE